ncbi:hypothetical protein ACFO3O_07470 [Dokdonia ponticola]|uniref:Lipoprotein n=1 Tax=Dokdonia ponticola TaxID=2041041 RepID=A0ABV9HW65_9FLAO
MNKYVLFLFATFSLFYGCSLPDDDVEGNQEEDLALLQDLFEEFATMTNHPCTDAEEWEFVAYGSKACGGPQGYIAYPTTIDVEIFLTLVENYTTEEAIYNSNYGIVSTCEIPAEPVDVICENEEAVLVYE